MSNAARNAGRFAEIGASGYVFAEDVIFLRREVFKDGIVSNSELDTLFALGERALKGDPEWPIFFEEAATDFYLRQQKPQGYLTPDQFESLRARITRDGDTASPLEFRLLMRLLETARETPPAMHAFIAGELRRAILGKGRESAVTREETSLVRRFIFAGGGAGNVAVTRDEAELIFDINDATMSLGNDPTWTAFFVAAISNHLMAHFTFAPPDRNEAFRLKRVTEDRTINPVGFLKRMLALAGLKGGEAGATQALRNEARERAIAEAEKIAPEEADWLADRIGRDGVLGEDERRLVSHIRDLGATLPPRLKALVDRAA